MSKEFTFHNLETAPEGSKPLLKHLSGRSEPIGFYAVLAESPQALTAYNDLHNAFAATSFSDTERTVIWQTINVENECHFCVPAHTHMAKEMNIAEDISNALRDETSLPNTKLNVLRDFVLILHHNRGHATDGEIAAFLDAGYTHQNILEIVVGIAEKTVSNYVNHLARTPPEKRFDQYAWSRATDRKS